MWLVWHCLMTGYPVGILWQTIALRAPWGGHYQKKQYSGEGRYLVCILSFLQQLKIKPSCQASGSGGVSVSAPPSLITCSNNFVPIVPTHSCKLWKSMLTNCFHLSRRARAFPPTSPPSPARALTVCQISFWYSGTLCTFRWTKPFQQGITRGQRHGRPAAKASQGPAHI